MEKGMCQYCGDLFPLSPRHKNQTCCKKPECQKAKRAERQRNKMQNNPVYKVNQKISNNKWLQSNPDYWKNYREKNPEKAERNRIMQTIRNRKSRSAPSDQKTDASLIAKMHASNTMSLKVVGQFWLVPMIAKMSASKINMIVIPNGYN